MESSSLPEQPGCAACGHEHLVEFYETEEFLVASVADFVTATLRADDAAIVVATPEHRKAFAHAVGARGIDIDEATSDGRYLAIDAAGLLSTFMVDGAPDRERFQAVVTPLLDLAADVERDVSVYGEMVALLWGAGDVMSTIAFEDLWNELASVRPFSLFCGYPISAFDVQSRAQFQHICGQHTGVKPPQRRPESA
jgi:hypothetical protein